MIGKGFSFVDEQTLNSMGDTLTERVNFLLQQNIKAETDPARLAAQNFLKKIQKSLQAWEKGELYASTVRKYARAINPLKDASNVDIDNFNKAKNKMLELRQNISIIDMNVQMENFQNALMEIMDKKIQLTYVYSDKDGTPYIFLIDDIKTILKQDVRAMSKGGTKMARINMSVSKFNEAKNNVLKNIKKLDEFDFMQQPALKHLQDARYSVLLRYNTYKSNDGHKHIILWRPQNQWKIVIMGNQKGDVEQAYVNALVHKTGFLNDFIEKNIDELMEYLGQVDAASGLLEGDVVAGEIQYAVKSGNAQNMSLKTAIDTAIIILSSNETFDKNKLNKLKEEMKKNIKPRNKTFLLSQVENELESIFKDKYEILFKI